MSITEAQLIEIQARLNRNSLRDAPVPQDAVDLEIPLHYEIISECKRRRWAYVHHRTDKRSGIQEGAQDFSIWGNGKFWAIEVKSKTGKLSPVQLAWKVLMETNGFTVHICRSFTEFIGIIEGI